MPFGRFLVSWKAENDPAEEAYTNTLYFNISNDPITPTGWTDLCRDIATVYSGTPWTGGRLTTVKAYDMGDAEPRPIKGQASVEPVVPTKPDGPGQVALCLSYYVDRNLPRFRGRIYTGPYSGPNLRPTEAQVGRLIIFADALAGIGGVNVDWSLWSPTRQQHERISNVWVDNSWDIIRSRKLDASSRQRKSING